MHLALECEDYLHLRVNHHHGFMRLFINDQLNVFHGPYLSLGDVAKMNAIVDPCERPATVFWRQWTAGVLHACDERPATVFWRQWAAGVLHACEAAHSDRLTNMPNAVV